MPSEKKESAAVSERTGDNPQTDGEIDVLYGVRHPGESSEENRAVRQQTESRGVFFDDRERLAQLSQWCQAEDERQTREAGDRQ